MAKQAKKTVVMVSHQGLDEYKGDVLAIGVYEKTSRLPSEYSRLDSASGRTVGRVLKLGDFSGRANEAAVLYAEGAAASKRIMLVGLGKKGQLDVQRLREVAGTAVRAAGKFGAARLGLGLHALIGTDKLDDELVGQGLSEGAIFGRYDYQDHVSSDPADTKAPQTMRVTLVEPRAARAGKLNRGRKVGVAVAEAQNLTRMVANRPGNEINPPSLAREVQRWARRYGLKCQVIDERRLADLKMNGILAVGAGSASKPRLIMLEYNGRRGAKKTCDAAIVGKAVTFDSGGISLKPPLHMEKMKFDKCGGCNVLGILAAAAQLKLGLNVIGLIPSAENLPSHSSYRPGDIVRTFSGKTVEIENTDAEGRMILCDALAYAAKMKPGAIIDMATLTGACVVALGEHHAGLFSNNAGLSRKLQQSGQASGEAVWAMPSGSEYLEQMKSKVADLRNVGGRGAGACTAAAFLGEFVQDVPWAHIDIAGTADTAKEKSYRGVGATGFGVRLVVEYLRQLR